MLMNGKIMFDRYYCIISAKHCENEENIGPHNIGIYIRFKCCLCWLQGGCTGWIINLGFLIAVWLSDILFLVFHEKVI